MRVIPSTMVSQHPDHASKPYWHTQEFITTRDETEECYLSFADLGLREYKWDWEGKYVDESVVERLLSDHYDFFKKHPLGKETFLTFRLPNPKVETEFRLGRAFMGILGAASLTRHFKLHTPPLFEVILPMTETAEEMISIQEAFHELASLRHPLYRFELNGLKHIRVIPLFEQVSTIVNSDKILKKYVNLYQKQFADQPAYLRPYVARSDPALNSGIVPTVLAIKIALSKYRQFEERYGIKLYPIIGSASLPFRGGLTPDTVQQFAHEYKGIRTALIQSAFRYDYEKKDVVAGLKKLAQLLPKQSAVDIPKKNLEQLEKIITTFENFYKTSIEGIAPIVNDIASQLPKRRERVQHVGLFGYSRGVGKVKLPRAIGFTAALYSIGIPPELIGTGRGLKAIKDTSSMQILEQYYLNLKPDLRRAGSFINKAVLHELAKQNSVWAAVESDIAAVEDFLQTPLEPITPEEKIHHKTTTKIFEHLKQKKELTKYIIQAAVLRKSLG